MNATILAVLTGRIQPFREDGETSAIGKAAVAGTVRIGPVGLKGDEQADPTVHGGPDKAIHHYPHDHYGWWAQEIGTHSLLQSPGAFGENISTEGMTEDHVCIGDRYRLGTSLVEVSQGRQPCWKVDHRFGGLAINAAIVRSRHAGWYYRVIEEGEVEAGNAITLLDRPFPDWSVSRVFGLLIAGDHKRDREGLEALGEVAVLADPWKRRRDALLR